MTIHDDLALLNNAVLLPNQALVTSADRDRALDAISRITERLSAAEAVIEAAKEWKAEWESLFGPPIPQVLLVVSALTEEKP